MPRPHEKLGKRIIVRVSTEVAEQVKVVARRHKWKTSDVVRAGLEKFLDEEKPEPKKFQLKQLDLLPTKSDFVFHK